MGQIPQKNQSDSECGGVARHLDAEQPFLRAVVRRVIPRPDAAAYVVQRINLAIWKKRSAFETGTSFRSWALAFVRYELLAYRRTLARSREVMLSLEAEELLVSRAASSPVSDLEDQQQALRECLDLLRPEQLQLLRARYERAESLEESAVRLGRTAGGMRVTIHRLRKSLKKCIESRMHAGRSELD